jgi:hypothetical protein
MAEASEKWLRPNVRPLLRLGALSAGRVGLILTVIYAVMWWNGVPHITVADWLEGMAMCWCALAPLFAIFWFGTRHISWRVGPEGIAVYHGDKLRRSFGWADVVSLQVLRATVIARLASQPVNVRLYWPEKEQAAWLRGYAHQRLADRTGGPA